MLEVAIAFEAPTIALVFFRDGLKILREGVARRFNEGNLHEAVRCVAVFQHGLDGVGLAPLGQVPQKPTHLTLVSLSLKVSE